MDSSALIAILAEEAEAEQFTYRILEAGDARIAAPNVLEYVMVATGMRLGFTAERALLLLQRLQVSPVAFSPAMVDLAVQAFLRFGKGRHQAGLNFGDCMAYALARSLDAPLLFKGTDFGRTDVRVADA